MASHEEGASRGVEEVIEVKVEERIATLMINRPGRRNALSGEVVEGLIARFDELGKREDVGVIVLTGAGDRVFCAGGDLGDQHMQSGALSMHHSRKSFMALMLAMQRCEKPIIARVNGHALGGGFGLALNCDLVVASEQATFGMPEIKVGLFPMMIMAVVRRNIGRKLTMEMMLTGDRVSAQVALEKGMINRAVSPERLDEEVMALAGKIAGHSPAILRLGRDAFYATQDMGFEQAIAYLQSQLTINTLAEDASEGIMAFLEKREPEWKGR